MANAEKKDTLTQRIYEFVKACGCATTEEIVQALDVSAKEIRSAIRSLFARRLVLPYRPYVGRERIFCIPTEGDKLYGRNMRAKSSGMISITLPIDMIEIIDEIATETGQTRSDIIRQAVMELIANYGRQQQSEESQEDEELDLIVPDR
jgi:Arc/MetJ-type ribon-helix-helix transcriptional regulator